VIIVSSDLTIFEGLSGSLASIGVCMLGFVEKRSRKTVGEGGDEIDGDE
jgi:hypothetical protein